MEAKDYEGKIVKRGKRGKIAHVLRAYMMYDEIFIDVKYLQTGHIRKVVLASSMDIQPEEYAVFVQK